MGPTRTVNSSRLGDSTPSSVAGPSKKRQKRHNHQPKDSPTGLPGVQKLKASLRQARRLLARDKLGANVRVETERRIKALEADLAQAQTSNKERDIAVRYHKVKFFERKKVVRKLEQTKKRLASVDVASKPQLEIALTELRVDLNYVLHYPKTKKYISLFPPNIREEGNLSEAPIPKVNADCEEVRRWIRTQMAIGELHSEPELHMDSRVEEKKTSRKAQADWDGASKKASAAAFKDEHEHEEEEDAFFGDDGEDESD